MKKKMRRGFTLIELIITLTISSMLLFYTSTVLAQQEKINNSREFVIEFTDFILSDIFGMNGYSGFLTRSSGADCPTTASTKPFENFSLKKVKNCVGAKVDILGSGDENIGTNHYYAPKMLSISSFTQEAAVKVHCDDMSDTQFICLIDGSMLDIDDRKLLEDNLQEAVALGSLRVKVYQFFPNATAFTHSDPDPAAVDSAGSSEDGICAISFVDVSL